MTSSNALKCVVSDYETTTTEVAPRKPFNINPSVLRDTKSLLYGSLQGTTSKRLTTTSKCGGVSQEAVKRYIQEQEGKEIFEYSVFGSPQQKIGDFTQTKLTEGF